MENTTQLENAYRRFGNVMHVEHWHNAKSLIGIMRPIVVNKTKEFNEKPKHWQRCIQLEYRPWERLSMNLIFDAVLISRNGRYINFYPKTALELERFARKKNKHDWRIEIIDAFETLIYQRQGCKKWLLIEIEKGYA